MADAAKTTTASLRGKRISATISFNRRDVNACAWGWAATTAALMCLSVVEGVALRPVMKCSPGSTRWPSAKYTKGFSSASISTGLTSFTTPTTSAFAGLAPWRGPKGNLSFPHKEPLPLELIGRAAAALAAQYGPR